MATMRAGARSGQDPRRLSCLVPATVQTLWGWPAIVNFTLGGLGAGFYVMAALAAGFGPSATVRAAAWLGPLLVLAGFAAVATEAGRPLRGPRVLARVRTSWMSRELWLGVAFALLAVGALRTEGPGPRAVAAMAGAGLALAQGQILRHARGVAAWSVPPMPWVFLTSALVSGAGLLLLLEPWSGRPLNRLLGMALVALVVHLCVWWLFVSWSSDEAFVHGLRPLRDGSSGLVMVVGGYLLPSLLAALAVALPPLGPALATAAGALMVAGQAWMKAALIRQAGQLRPITLPSERLHRRSP
jgi:formate-dependent nitrite reductase membrane component NrfD